MINLPSLDTAHVKGKKVFVRCDFDVPLTEKGSIVDDTRLVASISTIEYLLENGAMVFAAGHLGRPEKFDTKESLEPVARWFAEEFPGSTLTKTHINELDAWRLKDNFFLLENLRFNLGEESNDPQFAEKLSNRMDLYVNEAFASSHRAHASIVGVPSLLPHYAGFHLQKEVKILSGLLENPKRPLTVIVGGAKIETKLPLISKMHKFADFVLVGGELAEKTAELAIVEHEKSEHNSKLIVADLAPDKKDIDEESIQKFVEVIEKSKTIIWNGPMGEFEKCFDLGTREIANSIISSGAYSVVGGGDSLAFLSKEGSLPKFNFVSTGGGAMLEFLAGVALPGLLALQN